MSSNKDRREHAPQHFNTTARSLHWLMAVMILSMLFIGAAMMTSLHHRIWLIDLHRPLGIAILLLALVRLVNRLLSRTPHFLPICPSGGCLPQGITLDAVWVNAGNAAAGLGAAVGSRPADCDV